MYKINDSHAWKQEGNNQNSGCEREKIDNLK